MKDVCWCRRVAFLRDNEILLVFKGRIRLFTYLPLTYCLGWLLGIMFMANNSLLSPPMATSVKMVICRTTHLMCFHSMSCFRKLTYKTVHWSLHKWIILHSKSRPIMKYCGCIFYDIPIISEFEMDGSFPINQSNIEGYIICLGLK